MYRLSKPRALMEDCRQHRQKWPARSNFRTLRGRSSKRRAPRTSHPSRHSTRMASRRPSSRQRTSSRAEVTTSPIIRPQILKNNSSNKSGSPIKTSSWRTREEMRSRTPTCENGARPGAVWRQRSKGARSTSTRLRTLSRPGASSGPTGKPSTGTATTTQCHSNLQLIAKMRALVTKKKSGTPSTT